MKKKNVLANRIHPLEGRTHTGISHLNLIPWKTDEGSIRRFLFVHTQDSRLFLRDKNTATVARILNQQPISCWKLGFAGTIITP